MGLFNKHKHQWEVVDKKYVPPQNFPGGEGTGLYAARLFEIYEDCLYGYTEITYKCECGKYETEQLTGRVDV